MELKDPPRLLDPDAGARDFVRRALDAGRADRPDAAQLARLAQRLPLGAPPPPSDPGSPPTAAPPAPPAPIAAIPSALPGAVVGALLGLAAIGLQAWITRSDAPPSAPREAPAAIHVEAPAEVRAPERARRDEAIPAQKAAARALAAPALTASSNAEVAPRAADPTPSAPVAALAAPSGSSPALAAGSPEGAFAAGSPTVDSETDIQLLQRAQDALGSAPSRALDLVNVHAARFPGSALGQEREVLAIDALVRLGRLGEARARAAAFAARFPTSAHRHRLEALVPNSGIDIEPHKAPADPALTP